MYFHDFYMWNLFTLRLGTPDPPLNSSAINDFRWAEMDCCSLGNICWAVLRLAYSFLRTLERCFFSISRMKWSYVFYLLHSISC